MNGHRKLVNLGVLLNHRIFKVFEHKAPLCWLAVKRDLTRGIWKLCFGTLCTLMMNTRELSVVLWN